MIFLERATPSPVYASRVRVAASLCTVADAQSIGSGVRHCVMDPFCTMLWSVELWTRLAMRRSCEPSPRRWKKG